MKKKIVIIFSMFLLIFNIYGSVQSYYEQIMKKYDMVKTFQASLKQISYYSDLDIEKKSSGMLYYNNEKLLMDYNIPNIEQVLVENDLIRIYQKEDNRELITKLDSSFLSLNIKTMLNKFWNKSHVEIIEEDNKFIYFRLDIKDKDDQTANISIMELKVNKSDYVVYEIKYYDDSENSVIISFENIKINKDISKARWKLKLDDKTEIIDYSR